MEIDFVALASPLKQRTLENAPFTVRGYTSSTGRVSDKVLRYCGHDGYLLLLQESLRLLEHEEAELLWWFSDEDQPLATGVIASLRESLRKRLSPPEETAAPVKAAALPGEKLVDGLYLLPDGQGLVLTHLELLSEEVIEGGKISKSRDEASRIKKELEAMLPMANFLYRIDLKPGKFLDVQL